MPCFNCRSSTAASHPLCAHGRERRRLGLDLVDDLHVGDLGERFRQARADERRILDDDDAQVRPSPTCVCIGGVRPALVEGWTCPSRVPLNAGRPLPGLRGRER